MTRSIFLTLIGGLLAFTAGIVTAGSWHKATSPTIAVVPAKAAVTPQPTPPAPASTPEPSASESEVVFGSGRLKIVADEVRLKSERLYYDIKVRYPQIAGSDKLYIKKLNQRIRRVALDRYQWMLNPSKEDLLFYKTSPASFNEGYLDYEIVLATDSILSICFTSFDYGIGAAHTVIQSHIINYDLKAHRELELADLFKPNSKYVGFIARYCTVALKLSEPIAPETAIFASWNFTSDGIRFNFDPCILSGCSGPPQEVNIPFTALKAFLKQGHLV